MNSNLFALALAGVLLASCGGGDAANDAAPSTDAGTDAAASQTPAPASGAATPAPAAAAAQGETAAYAPGELLPGGAVDVLQREGFRPPA